jgi:hypothetical protein
MAHIQHVELSNVRPGMSVVVGSRKFGRLVAVEPQPDNRHVLRLITSRDKDGKLVEIPIDWVNYVEADHIQLLIDARELDELPEYIPDVVDSLRARSIRH